MKKHVQRVLLPLLFSCCFVFSGFLSVEAFAIDKFYNQVSPDEAPISMYYTGGSLGSSISPNNYGWYEFENAAYSNNLYLNAIFYSTWDIAFDTTNFDYYFNLMYESLSSDSFTFFPASARITEVGLSGDSIVYNIPSSDVVFNNFSGRTDGVNTKGFTVLGKMPDGFQGSIRSFYVANASGGSIPSNLRFTCTIIQVAKDSSSEYVQGIVAAINNQTSALGEKIDGAADDIQQSIEDQYSGTPEDQLDIDSVLTQHNEKMGVLSFGSDVMIQFLDMFQSANVGAAQLTLPGFAITVENQEHQVWPDYSFNFEQLNEWVPGLMSVIRMMLPAFVWLMVLRYIVNVFEKNFLSNGG